MVLYRSVGVMLVCVGMILDEQSAQLVGFQATYNNSLTESS